jgi:formiminotetrahydrofolate cyclodeaminase
MVGGLPQTRSDTVDDRAKLIEAASSLSEVQEQLLEAVETQTAVKIFAARNMPQASQAQRATRQAAIQVALRPLRTCPLEALRLCAHGVKNAATVAADRSRAASVDVQLGVGLLHTAFVGARSHLEGRMSTITDTTYITSVVDEIERLSEEATATPGVETSPP